jgi:hypothetical protein
MGETYAVFERCARVCLLTPSASDVRDRQRIACRHRQQNEHGFKRCSEFS